MDIYEIVKKLVGEISPIGETNADSSRYNNLVIAMDLVGRLVTDIEHVADYKSKVEFSMKRAGKVADKFLRDDLNINYEDKEDCNGDCDNCSENC